MPLSAKAVPPERHALLRLRVRAQLFNVTFESWSTGVLQLEMYMQSEATLPGVGATEQKKTTRYIQSLHEEIRG